MEARASNFIEKSKVKHNNKYDYSKINYVNTRTKVKIICPKHGDFEQTPKDHLHGGCRKCGSEITSSKTCGNKDRFIRQAQSVHGNKYDYSKVVYVKAIEKVIIICRLHGDFEQAPSNHLSLRQGCPSCSGRNKNTQTFIEQARSVHREVYDYSKVAYVKAIEKVIIICPKHGEFLQSPAGHLKGAGCSACRGVKKLTTEGFIERLRAKHGDKYDYSKVDYVNASTKVKIICPAKFDTGTSHGEFEQVPGSHLRGFGCPKCNLCPSCGIWRTYGKKCEYCIPSAQNNCYTKTKEYAVVKYLKENLPNHDPIHNKSVGKDCTNGNLFPDVRYDRGFYSLIVEVDEHKHRGADYKCDEQRMYDIMAKLGQPCIFIRYNPDGKKSDKNTLLDKIKQYIEIDPGNDSHVWDEYGFYCEYLFY